MEEEIEPVCEACGGYGYTIEIEAECCNCPTENNDCCNVPVPVQVQVKCFCNDIKPKTMTAKEQKIKEAYKEYTILYKHINGENGWSGDKFGVLWQKYKNDENFDVRNNEYNTNGTIRPKSLQGIENNNGWIKIESEEDLPEQGGSYYVTRYGKIETAVYVKNNRWLVNGNDYPKTTIRHSITHYQPIVKPEPPIY